MTPLERAWWAQQPSAWQRAMLGPLWPAETLFGALVRLRGLAYDRRWLAVARAPAPVISVGNVAVGGAGKTPVTHAIATRLAARGRRVAILSRGYGAVRTDPRIVADGERVLLGAEEGGDEPVLLARRLPGVRVLCGPRRAELAAMATGPLGADALLLDDGFQHRALARDLDVVVLDAANPFGNAHLLPVGPNREPRRALRRAGLVWLSRVDQATPEQLERLRVLAFRYTERGPVESRHAPLDLLDGTLTRSRGLAAARGKRVLLLSGLARPGAFRTTVEGLGAEVVAERRHADHHRFTAADLDAARAAADAARAELILTTEKDAVRLPAAWADEPRLAVVRIEAELVAGDAALRAALDGALVAGDGRAGRDLEMNFALDLLGKIPRTILVGLGHVLGWLLWISRIRRRVALDNLRLAFPEKSEAERRAILRAHCDHLGQMIPDFLRVPTLPPEELDRMFEYQGWDSYERAAELGKGVVACTAHFGNFDLLSSAHNRKGVPITQLSREMGANFFNELLHQARRRSGVHDLIISKGQTLRVLLRALKEQRTLGFVYDQNEVEHPIFPTFFGVPAATTSTPAFLARRAGAAVIFVISVPLGGGRHRVVLEGPLVPRDTGDKEADDLAFMQLLNDKLEAWVRRHPERWYWLHRRWKTRPPAPGPAAARPPAPAAPVVPGAGEAGPN